MNLKFYSFFIFISFQYSFAQTNAIIKGTVLEPKTLQPISNVVVTIQNTPLMQLTKTDGSFLLPTVLEGDYFILIKHQNYKESLFPVHLSLGQTIDLQKIILEEDQPSLQQNNTILLSDDDLSDDNANSQMTATLLQSSKDVFQMAAAFNWGQARFSMRGLDSEHANTLINGLKMNKPFDGRPQWNNWGGLNDATRNQEFSFGTAASDFGFRGLLGTQQINTRASGYRKGNRISFSGTNTNYNWRSQAIYASGLNTKGWAYVFSASKRWANQSYFEGSFYDANSVFFSIEKFLNAKHSLNFTAFYTPNSRGKNSPNTAEVSSLMGNTYNSYWGFQDGKKRNARVKTVQEPVVMLNHTFAIDSKTQWKSGVMYQFGSVGNSNIDYQNAMSPDPTYFRKLPSYYSSLYAADVGEFSGAFTPDFVNANLSKTNFLAQPQIDWDALYKANQSTILDANGQIIGYQPAQSRYVLYEDRTDDQLLLANSVFDSELNDHLVLQVGANFSTLKSHNYQKLTDLLGGAFFEDVDLYYKGNEAQADLNFLDRKVGVGEAYGYNFNYFATSFDTFTQFKFSYPKYDFYLTQTLSTTQYQREGLFKNGLYPLNSFGKSEKISFENFGFKGGFIYKISGKKSVAFNGAILNKAPNLKNVFPNARLNNSLVSGLSSENFSSLDVSYHYNSPLLKTRVTLYYINQKNATATSFLYAEGILDNGAGYDNTNAFLAQTLTGIDKVNRGIEYCLEYPWTSTLKSTLALGFGQSFYSSNPNLTVSNDAFANAQNSNTTVDFGTAFLKNYKQAVGPQQAYSVGLEYRDPSYWWVASNLNFLADSYIDVAAIARTNRFYVNPTSGFPFPEANETRGQTLLEQEKLPSVFLLNLIGGKSWRFKNRYISLFCSINNLLDVHYKTGGYEQARNANFRQRDQDASSQTPSFGNKYFNGYGRTYFVNLSFSL